MQLQLPALTEHRAQRIRRIFQSLAWIFILEFFGIPIPRSASGGRLGRGLSNISGWSISRWCSSPKKQNRWKRIGHVLRKGHQLELMPENLYRNPVAFFVSKLSLCFDFPDSCVDLCRAHLSRKAYQKVVGVFSGIL